MPRHQICLLSDLCHSLGLINSVWMAVSPLRNRFRNLSVMFITSSLKGQREREFGWVFAWSSSLAGCRAANPQALIGWETMRVTSRNIAGAACTSGFRPFGCLLPCEQNLFPLEKRPPAFPRGRDSARRVAVCETAHTTSYRVVRFRSAGFATLSMGRFGYALCVCGHRAINSDKDKTHRVQ